jgi:hypothetical protein
VDGFDLIVLKKAGRRLSYERASVTVVLPLIANRTVCDFELELDSATRELVTASTNSS